MKVKARANLKASQALIAGNLIDSAMSRLYYALFQAGVHALRERSLTPEKLSSDARDGEWGHTLVRNNARLCRSRSDDRRLFRMAFSLRSQADYDDSSVDAVEVERIAPAIHAFVEETCR